MSIFVDSCIFFAMYSKNDVHHDEAVRLLEFALSGKGGTIYTSDYVFDETVTLARVRTHNAEIPLMIGKAIIDSPRVIMLKVDDEVFNQSWDIFNEYCSKGLSFTDCSSIAFVKTYEIDTIFSFDSHFDGIINRNVA
ncbi:MAG: PIN domain-containing protein [Methanosarcinaceae archaeon]|nr:PIN domain-containing protein [Methanosarcinaceae archaeon]